MVWTSDRWGLEEGRDELVIETLWNGCKTRSTSIRL